MSTAAMPAPRVNYTCYDCIADLRLQLLCSPSKHKTPLHGDSGGLNQKEVTEVDHTGRCTAMHEHIL